MKYQQVENADCMVSNWVSDLPVNRDDISDVVWKLLEDYLNKYEEPGMTTLHYVVCKKIISLNIYIPFWLMNSYKVSEASDLIRFNHSKFKLLLVTKFLGITEAATQFWAFRGSYRSSPRPPFSSHGLWKRKLWF